MQSVMDLGTHYIDKPNSCSQGRSAELEAAIERASARCAVLQAEVAQERTMNTKNREVMQDMQREVQRCHNSQYYVTAAGWF